MDKESFAQLFKKARESKGITKYALAKKTGFTYRAIVNWEQGKNSISLENADKLLKALGVEVTIGCLINERKWEYGRRQVVL